MIVTHHTSLSLGTSRVVLLVILVATAIPTAVGPPSFQWRRWDLTDILANILLYVPIGLALGQRASARRTAIVSAALSTAIEVAQLFYVNRIAHPVDVAFNVAGALAGHAMTPHVRLQPHGLRLSRPLGVALLALAGVWILSSRTFRMYLGGYGWFATGRSHPRFWSLLPPDVIRAGVEIHGLGLLANTAIASLLATAGVIGLLQARHPAFRTAAAITVGFSVGTMMTPNLNVFPLAPAVAGTVAGVALAASCVSAADARV